MTDKQQIADLKARVKRLENTLGTLIAWMANSSVSPISISEARTLLDRLDGKP